MQQLLFLLGADSARHSLGRIPRFLLWGLGGHEELVARTSLEQFIEQCVCRLVLL